MPSPPSEFNPSHQDASAALQQGLMALKQKQYDRAIQWLTQVVQQELDPVALTKAQMGLVKAYGRTGRQEAAIAQCKQLASSDSPKVQAWAQKTLQDLAAATPADAQVKRQAAASSSGTSPGTSPGAAPITEAQADSSSTGFVPLDDESSQAASAGTGFVPLQDDNLPTSQPQPQRASSAGRKDSSGLSPAQRQDAQKAAPLDQSHSGASGANISQSSQASVRPGASGLTSTPDVSENSSLPPTAKRPESTGTNAGMEETASGMATDAEADSSQADSSQAQSSALAPPTPAASDYQPHWREAERAQRWPALPMSRQVQFVIVQVLTVGLSVWLIRTVLWFVQMRLNRLLAWVEWPIDLSPIQAFYNDPLWFVIWVLAILYAASPWLWDGILTWFYGQQAMQRSALDAESPEAVRLLRKHFLQQSRPEPSFRLLPTQAVVIFTYGNLPRFARVTVSRGLLSQLNDDEIAALYAREISQIQRWDFALLSWLTLLSQIPYLLYMQASTWGDRMSNSFLRGCLAFVAAAGYGLYWLLRWLGLWLSRGRTSRSDRTAVSMTGNPNGLSRALLKVAIGNACDIQRQGQTSDLLESLESLCPVGLAADVTLGSVYPHAPIEPVLQWDYSNPQRHWLAISRPHPPLGERLYRLTRQAVSWHLTPEFDLPSPSLKSPRTLAERWTYWQPLLLQASPLVGLAVGGAIALLLKFIGYVAPILLGLNRLGWMVENQSLLPAGLLIGFGIGTWLRVNRLFPDFTPGAVRQQPPLSHLLKDVNAIPVDTIPVRLQGKLIGRSGVSNWLGQDLLLQTEQGVIKLRYASALGIIGNLFLQSAQIRPDALSGRYIQIVGWFRRSVLSWIDLDYLSTQHRNRIQANSPISATLLGLAAVLWGMWLLLFGG